MRPPRPKSSWMRTRPSRDDQQTRYSEDRSTSKRPSDHSREEEDSVDGFRTVSEGSAQRVCTLSLNTMREGGRPARESSGTTFRSVENSPPRQAPSRPYAPLWLARSHATHSRIPSRYVPGNRGRIPPPEPREFAKPRTRYHMSHEARSTRPGACEDALLTRTTRLISQDIIHHHELSTRWP